MIVYSNRLVRRRSKKASKLRAGEFPAQMASNANNFSIWWRHHCPIYIKYSVCLSLLEIVYPNVDMSILCLITWCDWWKLYIVTLRWRHNDHAGVSNHQPHGCLLNRLFRRKSKKTSKLRVTGLCAGNSSGTGEFPAQMASYAENVSIWWRHHECGH